MPKTGPGKIVGKMKRRRKKKATLEGPPSLTKMIRRSAEAIRLRRIDRAVDR